MPMGLLLRLPYGCCNGRCPGQSDQPMCKPRSDLMFSVPRRLGALLDPFGLRESSSNAARCAPIIESAPRYIPGSQVKDDIWIDRQKQPEIDADAFV